MKSTPTQNIHIKELENSEIEITGSVESQDLEKYRAKALQHINEHVSIDGFRKGNVPEKVLVSKVGEMPILEEMAELALASVYPHLIMEHKLEVIGRPSITITKLATGIPLEFKITTAILPKFDLPDYKKIAADEMKKKNDPITVEDKEIEQVITQARRSRVDHSSHDHSGDEKAHEEAIEKALPEFNDEFVKSLGDFKDVEDFKTKVKEGLTQEKEHKMKEKKRAMIAEKIISETKATLPKILIDSELNKLEAQFKDDISRMGVKVEDYLSHIKKTMEELRADWTKDAEKKAKFQLILNKIAITEKIQPEKEEVEKEIKHILAHYKDADPENARIYVESLLTNEKIFQLFETQK